MVDQFMDCERGALVGYHRVERRLLASIDLSELSVKQLTLVLLHDENEVLLGMKKRGFGEGKWNGFGGKVEPGETILDAAVRELEEECGASVAPQELVQRALLTFIFEKNPKIMQVQNMRSARIGLTRANSVSKEICAGLGCVLSRVGAR